MPDREDAPPHTPTRRRREQSGAEGTLSVADLLARYAREREDLPNPRRAAPDPGGPAPELTEQFTLGDTERTTDPGDTTDQVAPEATAEGPLDRLSAASSPPGGALVGSEAGILRWPVRMAGDDVEDDVDDDEAVTEVVPRVPADDEAPAQLTETAAGDGPEAAHEPGRQVPPETAAEVTDVSELVLRTRAIDESLHRLTAIHAGLGAEVSDRIGRSERSAPVDGGPPDEPGAAEPGDLAPKPAGPWARVRRAGLAALAAAVFLALGAGWSGTVWLDGKLRPVAALDPGSDAVRDAAAQAGDENYLLVGTDSDIDPGAGGPGSSRGLRSDTVLLVHVPADRDGAVVVAFPRDVRVDRPSCDRWDPPTATYPAGTTPAQAGVPLDEVFRVGGPRCLTKAVQKLTGMPVRHFAAVGYDGLPGMVDAAGGVPICLDRPVVDGALGRVVPTAGRTVLTGEQALGLVRARDVRGDPTSGYGQIQRQERFLAALAGRGLSEDVLLSPGALGDLMGAFAAHSLTDGTDLDALTVLGGALRNADPAKVMFVTVPTVTAPSGDSAEYLRDAEATALFTALRTDRPLPGPPSTTAADDTRAADALPPSEVTLSVRNGSSRAGLAGQVADNLRSVGFTVAKVGDAGPSTRTLIRHSADRSAQAATVAAAVPSAVNQAVPGPPGVLELVLGDGFDGEVSTAGLAGAPESPAVLTGVPSTLASLTTCR